MWAEILFIFCITILLLYLDTKKPSNYPPGPKWLPILGSAWDVRKARQKFEHLGRATVKMGEEYSPSGVLGLRVGIDRIVIPFTRESIKEMLLNEDFDGRPLGLFYDTRTLGVRRGIVLTDENVWKEHRRFLVRHLKDFGLGRRGMVEIIEAEAEQILKDMNAKLKAANNNSIVIPLRDHFSVHVLNTLWSMMTSIRYDSNDEELKILQKLVLNIFASVDMMGSLFSHFPFLRYVAPTFSGYKYFAKSHKKIWHFIKTELQSHQKKFILENEDRDFMDVYIRKLKSSDSNSVFNEPQLLAVCMDLFMAGSETTSKTLGFAFLNLLKYPEIQENAQKEIDMIIGHDRMPRLDDRVNMPYNEALVMESIRHFMGRGFGIPHRALKDTKLCGYNVPKNTIVVPNFVGMLMDEKLFKDPYKFVPERFLVNDKITSPEAYIPFGIGKHRCIGESLGKSDIFMFVVTMLQNFDFKVPEGHPLPTIDCIDGATPSAGFYYAQITPRIK